MVWEVALPQALERFKDASGHGVEVDGDLMDSLKAMIESGKGKAVAEGISWAKREFGTKQPGEKFYILTVKKDGRTYSLLFKLSEKEKSRLIGNEPNLAREQLLEVIYDILSRRADEVKLVI